jgi:hypothetical protein
MTAAERIASTASVIARMRRLGQLKRPVWIGDDGLARIAHTDCMREMLERLGVRTVA